MGKTSSCTFIDLQEKNNFYSELKDVMTYLLIHHAEPQPPHLSHVLFALQYDITPLCETDTLIPPSLGSCAGGLAGL